MTTKVISMKEDNNHQCECGGSWIYQSEWDRLFDKYDPNTPAFDLIYARIYQEDNEPKYVCDSCKMKVYVVPEYKLKK